MHEHVPSWYSGSAVQHRFDYRVFQGGSCEKLKRIILAISSGHLALWFMTWPNSDQNATAGIPQNRLCVMQL